MDSTFQQKLTMHKMAVDQDMNFLIRELRTRSKKHDVSKRSGVEYAMFSDSSDYADGNVIWGVDMKGHPTPSTLESALIIHSQNNDYRPEHFENGVCDMTFPQLIEMLCDITATARERGITDISVFIRHELATKYGLDKQLCNVLVNTANEILSRNR